MIYTEYFAKGSQPSGICPLHPHRGFSRPDRRRVRRERCTATGLRRGCRARPVLADQYRPAASPAAPPPSPNAPPAPKAEEEKKDKDKKPGFWGRLFGKKDKNDEKKDEKKDPPKKKPGGGF